MKILFLLACVLTLANARNRNLKASKTLSDLKNAVTLKNQNTYNSKESSEQMKYNKINNERNLWMEDLDGIKIFLNQSIKFLKNTIFLKQKIYHNFEYIFYYT